MLNLKKITLIKLNELLNNVKNIKNCFDNMILMFNEINNMIMINLIDYTYLLKLDVTSFEIIKN